MKAILPILLLGATLVSAETPVTTSSSRMTDAAPARFLAEELDELREEVETIPQRITPALLQQRSLVDVEQSLEDLLNEALAALTKVESVFLSKKVL